MKKEPKIKVIHPCFNMAHLPIRKGSRSLNWNNWEYWKFWMRYVKESCKNLFVVNKYFIIQSDGVRRVEHRLGFKHHIIYELD